MEEPRLLWLKTEKHRVLCHSWPLRSRQSGQEITVLATHTLHLVQLFQALLWRDISSAPGNRNSLLQPLKQGVSDRHQSSTTARPGIHRLFHVPDFCGPSGQVTPCMASPATNTLPLH